MATPVQDLDPRNWPNISLDAATSLGARYTLRRFSARTRFGTVVRYALYQGDVFIAASRYHDFLVDVHQAMLVGLSAVDAFQQVGRSGTQYSM